MSQNEISDLVMRISDSNLEFPNQVNALVIAMVNLDESRFEKIISTNTLQFGFEKTMLNIVYPFLSRIGILWQTGNINPAHEHFITNLIRQKLIVAIDGQMAPQNPNAKRFVLFLPEGELHELSLLFGAYIIKSRHNKVIYLGQSLPLKDLTTVYEVYEPDYIFTLATNNPTRDELPPFVDNVLERFPNVQLLMSGYQAIQLKNEMPENVVIFETIDEMITFVDEVSEKPFGSNEVSRSA
ncbi:MAG: B12-binding domain-containing protein [Bacteroidota bacterium]